MPPSVYSVENSTRFQSIDPKTSHVLYFIVPLAFIPALIDGVSRGLVSYASWSYNSFRSDADNQPACTVYIVLSPDQILYIILCFLCTRYKPTEKRIRKQNFELTITAVKTKVHFLNTPVTHGV